MSEPDNGSMRLIQPPKKERKQKFVALGIVHKSVLEILMFLYDTLVAMAWMKVIMASSP